MNRTKIEWVKNPDGSQGFTWNPLTGCLNHVDGMCKGGNFPCYAYRLANGRLKSLYLANDNIAPSFMNINHILDDKHRQESGYADPFYPRLWPERLSIPEPPVLKGYSKEVRFALQQKYRRGIFVCDMSDLFGIGIPEEWTQRVMSEVRMHPEHRFYLLTKQPQNLVNFSPFPDNCWVGVTATGDDMFNDACYYLDRIVATVKYISVEPLLRFISGEVLEYWLEWKRLQLGQVIIGAQTKPYKPPKIEWVEEIVRAADKAGIPVFLKDNLVPILPVRKPFITEAYIDGDGNLDYSIRQELPSR